MACCKGGRCSIIQSRNISQQEQEKIALNLLHKKKQKELLDKKRKTKEK